MICGLFQLLIQEEVAPNHAGLKAIGHQLSRFDGYRSCQASTCLYTASGTTDDWAYSELGIPAFTVEIGQKFMPAYSEIDRALWPENLPALLYAAKIARAPYEHVLGPDVDDIESTVTAENSLILFSATIDNSDHGAGQVTAASYSP